MSPCFSNNGSLRHTDKFRDGHVTHSGPYQNDAQDFWSRWGSLFPCSVGLRQVILGAYLMPTGSQRWEREPWHETSTRKIETKHGNKIYSLQYTIMNYVVNIKLYINYTAVFLKCVLDGTVELLDQPLPKVHTILGFSFLWANKFLLCLKLPWVRFDIVIKSIPTGRSCLINHMVILQSGVVNGAAKRCDLSSVHLPLCKASKK